MRVLVRGAGIIGLAVAEELLLRGHRVRVVDPAPCSGASGVAAGMLAPAAEASFLLSAIWRAPTRPPERLIQTLKGLSA